MSNSLHLFGILNITPDSFSDGGIYFSTERAVKRAYELIEQGADRVDIGADSTRPGSQCVGPDEEWKRLEPVLQELAPNIPLSLDTHHSVIAERALEYGVEIMNDVTAGFDSEMFRVVRGSQAKIVLMYSRCDRPHSFRVEDEGDLVTKSIQFLVSRIEVALSEGVRENQIILDPGMGKFISDSPARSWELIGRMNELAELGFPLFFGSSRKGFLREEDEEDISERDSISALSAVCVAERVLKQVPLYIRAHNISLHRQFLSKLPYLIK